MRTIISLLTILVLADCAFGTEYLIEDGDFFEGLSLHDYDTLLMTGGGYHLNLFDYSSAFIEGTDPLISEGDGGIWMIDIGDYCELFMSSGEVHMIDISGNARMQLSGGRVDELWSWQMVVVVFESVND